MNELTKPIQPHEIEWRVQQQTKTGKLIIVPYITNRCVMDRFDEAFGWNGWSSEFREIEGGFICRITVYGDIKVYKEDGAPRTSVEPEKGGISDSMKRCAVQFGLGRNLYSYPKVMIETNDKYIPDWAYPRLEGMVNAINNGDFKRDLVILKQEQ